MQYKVLYTFYDLMFFIIINTGESSKKHSSHSDRAISRNFFYICNTNQKNCYVATR